MAETLISDVSNADQMPAAPLPLLSDQDAPVEAVSNPQSVEVAAPAVTAAPADADEDWIGNVYGGNAANRNSTRGPGGQALSEEGLDARNVLDADAFGGATRLLERMIAPYKSAADAVGDVTWEGVHSASREAGNAIVTGVGTETIYDNLKTLLATVTLVDFEFGGESRKVAVDREASGFLTYLDGDAYSSAPNSLAARRGVLRLVLAERIPFS